MPGPRRRKPPNHNFEPLSLPDGCEEVWVMEWFEFGIAELGDYLAKCLRFADYLDKHPRDDPALD